MHICAPSNLVLTNETNKDDYFFFSVCKFDTIFCIINSYYINISSYTFIRKIYSIYPKYYIGSMSKKMLNEFLILYLAKLMSPNCIT